MTTDEEDAAKISAPGKALAVEFWSAVKAARSAVSERGFAWMKIDALISRFEEKWRVRLAEVSDLALEITFTNQELRKRPAMAEDAAEKGEKGRALGTAMEGVMAELEAIDNYLWPNGSGMNPEDWEQRDRIFVISKREELLSRERDRIKADIAAVEKERDEATAMTEQWRIECEKGRAIIAQDTKDLAEVRERLAKSEKENRVQFDALARAEREVIALREHAKRVQKLASEDSMAEQRKRLVAESKLEKAEAAIQAKDAALKSCTIHKYSDGITHHLSFDPKLVESALSPSTGAGVTHEDAEKRSKAAERILKAKALARMVCDTLEEGQSEVLPKVCPCGGDLEFAPYEISEPHSFRSLREITRDDSRLRCKKCGASFTVAP